MLLILSVIKTFLSELIKVNWKKENRFWLEVPALTSPSPKPASPQQNRLDIAVSFWSEEPSPK